jgi:hypothetical protein
LHQTSHGRISGPAEASFDLSAKGRADKARAIAGTIMPDRSRAIRIFAEAMVA